MQLLSKILYLLNMKWLPTNIRLFYLRYVLELHLETYCSPIYVFSVTINRDRFAHTEFMAVFMDFNLWIGPGYFFKHTS